MSCDRLRRGRSVWLLAATSAWLWASHAALALAASRPDRVGDEYIITRALISSGTGANGSTSRSEDRDTLTERVVGVRADGVEVDYMLPASATAQERAGNWRFPLRLFRPFSGSLRIVNRAEVEARIAVWLVTAKVPRSACGTWVFTWNAFKIECDPDAALAAVMPFDLRSADLYDGAAFRDPAASRPMTLTTTPTTGSVLLSGEAPLSPEAVRRARAETDVIVAGMIGKRLTLDAAIAAHAHDEVTGSIAVTIAIDPAGYARRLTRVTKVHIGAAGGTVDDRTSTEIVERRLVVGQGG